MNASVEALPLRRRFVGRVFDFSFDGYQRNVAPRLPNRTTPHVAQEMERLTGDGSTSEWVRREIQAVLGSEPFRCVAATVGVALCFISSVRFPGENEVQYPPMPAGVSISFDRRPNIRVDSAIKTGNSLACLVQGVFTFTDYFFRSLILCAKGKPLIRRTDRDAEYYSDLRKEAEKEGAVYIGWVG